MLYIIGAVNSIPLDTLSHGAATLGVTLSPHMLDAFEKYASLLIAWNKKINLTAIVVPQHIVEKHFLDSLSLLALLPQGPASIIDIGTGAGFPGIPLAIVRPDLAVTLVEATAKKASFLKAIKTALGLRNVTIVIDRAETLAHQPRLRETFDVAVGRAVAQLATLTELTLPFVRINGMVVAQKNLGSESIERATVAIETLGGVYEKEVAVPLPALADRRLIVIRKKTPTLAMYPRRVGVPAKKPIGN